MAMGRHAPDPYTPGGQLQGRLACLAVGGLVGIVAPRKLGWAAFATALSTSAMPFTSLLGGSWHGGVARLVDGVLDVGRWLGQIRPRQRVTRDRVLLGLRLGIGLGLGFLLLGGAGKG